VEVINLVFFFHLCKAPGLSRSKPVPLDGWFQQVVLSSDVCGVVHASCTRALVEELRCTLDTRRALLSAMH
jgi:hypothetical protein